MAGNATFLFLPAFGLGVYAVTVIIFWRNLGFSQPWKAVFALSVLPVFTAAMVLNIWLVNTYAPWLFEILGWAEGSGIPKIEPLIGLVISTPVAILITAAWYLLLRSLDRATKVEELKPSG